VLVKVTPRERKARHVSPFSRGSADETAVTRMDTNQMAHQRTTLECQVIKQEDSTFVTAVVESLD